MPVTHNEYSHHTPYIINTLLFFNGLLILQNKNFEYSDHNRENGSNNDADSEHPTARNER